MEDFFHLKERGSSVGTELRGALATFLTMSYIVFTNPAILKAAGVPFEAAAACTAAAAALSCILMGLTANFPLALASGMGLNSVIALQVTPVAGSWQTAMGLVILDGLVVLALVLTGLRAAVMRAIPRDLRLATGAGIGLFIAFIGAVNGKLVVIPQDTLAVLAKDPQAALPPVTYRSFRAPEVWVTIAGLFLTSFLLARGFRGALVGGILFSTALALALGITKLPTRLVWPRFDIAFQADVLGALQWRLLPLLLALLLVDFFDTLGTATAISEQAGLTGKGGEIPGLKRILAVDAVSASIGGLLGVSSVTSYIESAAGVAEGARTGLHSVFVGLLFLVAVFVAPLAEMVPVAATASTLILVGFLMCSQIQELNYEDRETAIPAFIILLTIPLTFSIAHGIGFGFITFVIIKMLSGKFVEAHPFLIATSILFAIYFIWGNG